VVRGLGHDHVARAALDPSLGLRLVAACIVGGLAFGVTAAVFVRVTSAVRSTLVRAVRLAPLRPAVGGVAVLALGLLAGRDYFGLSLPLLDRALAGDDVELRVFALKLVLTAVTIGSGFPGGEVTPLFVIGSTLGAALAGPLGAERSVLAALGLAAVFSAAARTPVAGAVLTVELFGSGVAPAAVLVCIVAAATAVLAGGPGLYGGHGHVAGGVSAAEDRPRRAGRGGARRWRCRGG
jgi:H+/Cl- antiporter ClcA